MNKISMYVENSFAALPRTKEVTEMKLNIIESMEERYEALLAEGKNENEAFGAVISEFGSMEDIREELNLEEEPQEVYSSPLSSIPEEFLMRYDQFNRLFSIAIAAGVIFCILGIVVQQILEAIFGDSPIAIVGFFLMIAVGVGIFIVFGIQKSHFEEEMERYKVVQPQPQPMMDSYHEKRANALAERLSGAIMLTATGIYLLLGFVLNLWHPGWVVFPIGGILCAIVSVLLGAEK